MGWPVCRTAGLPVPTRACMSHDGPVCSTAGLPVPRRARLSYGGPARPETGPSVPRWACLSRGGAVAGASPQTLFVDTSFFSTPTSLMAGVAVPHFVFEATGSKARSAARSREPLRMAGVQQYVAHRNAKPPTGVPRSKENAGHGTAASYSRLFERADYIEETNGLRQNPRISGHFQKLR